LAFLKFVLSAHAVEWGRRLPVTGLSGCSDV
jgi:hypothetical protein